MGNCCEAAIIMVPVTDISEGKDIDDGFQGVTAKEFRLLQHTIDATLIPAMLVQEH